MLYIIIWIITLLIVLWAAGSYLVVAKLESPEYEVLDVKDWYEIRQYKSYLAAEVEIQWNQNKALNDWFRYLAGYIFWWNQKSESISMTTPVANTQSSSENISMTTPVTDSVWKNNVHTIQFSLPSKYTLETLPKPINDKVKLREVQWYKAAALSFTLWATPKKVEESKQLLREKLQRDNIIISWDMISAQYNPPASFPLTRRNEIIVPIK